VQQQVVELVVLLLAVVRPQRSCRWWLARTS
jgi:hypothetical protein